jgi:cell division septum initiation protein DivIVA
LINYCSYTSQERVHILDSLRAFSNPQLLDRVVSALELMTENHQLRESITQTHKDLESIRDQVDTTAIAAANAGDGHRIRIAIATARAFAILG